MDTAELADMVLERLSNNILVILNTKSAVRKLYQEISGRTDEQMMIFQLTTYMCAEHRLDLIKEMKERLSEENGKKLICVSTQLIEAGVDISFETVIRSLAGLDSIAQAAGRCNRNGEGKIGKVFVVDYKEENVSKLPDIVRAQEAVRKVFDRYNGDLLNQSALDLYYRQYFFDRQEEMLCCHIEKGYLYYGEPRRRTEVIITDDLRNKAEKDILEMHDYLERRHTPKVKMTKKCNACSLKNLCVPKLMKNTSAKKYVEKMLGEED